jgi:hypothetical protein
MSGAIVLPFPERTYKPQADVVAAIMEMTGKDDLSYFAAAKAMLNAVEINAKKELTSKRMQLLVNCVAVAYLSLGRLIGEAEADVG